jgi:hypothetical protein
MQAQDFVTPEGQYTEQAKDMSGVRGASEGMAPYPLYGLPNLGAEEAPVVFYKRPWFCWGAGISLGLAAGFVVGQVASNMGWKPIKKNSKKRKAKAKAKKDS